MGSSANGTASRDSGIDGDMNYANFPAAFMAGLPGFSNGFPGFPFGFPAQGLAGGGQTKEETKKSKVPSFMDTGFMSGGNIDFMKMATLVRCDNHREGIYMH